MAFVGNVYGMGVPAIENYQNCLLNERMAASLPRNDITHFGFYPDYRYNMVDTASVPRYEYIAPKQETLQDTMVGYGNMSSVQPLDRQNPLVSMVGPNNLSVLGNSVFPIEERQSSQSCKSNKVRAKIQMLHPFYSRRLTGSQPVEGKTRTRDKYRIVYTDKQRIGLEKAYKEDKFITSAKKAELSKNLGLSDRQIKIWFQNRRAKERREVKKSSPVGSPNSSADDNMEEKPSCRFQKENISPSTLQHPSGFTGASTNSIEFPGNTLPAYNYFEDYNPYKSSMMSQPANYSMKEQEVTSKCPEVSHSRFQRSPSEWMDAYTYQPVMNTVNVSPFTSSMDMNFLSRV